MSGKASDHSCFFATVCKSLSSVKKIDY